MRVIVAARRNSSRAPDAAELEHEIIPHTGQEMVGLAMESFFALLQKNVVDRQRWATREDLRLAIITWIERTYHRRRQAAGTRPPHTHRVLAQVPDARGAVYGTDDRRREAGSAGLSGAGNNVTVMKLEMMTEQDVELRVRQQTDPQMMAELGGPRPREAIERAHAKSLALAAEGRCWPLKVVLDGASSPAGGVDVFESSHEGETIYEIGWMILPEFQNRGIAGQAVREVLQKAQAERKFGQIHAFPAVTNGPSNKICEKNGFSNLGECEFEFAGRSLRCNHWRIDLF